jgi:2-oxoglutarate decarboxylase
VSTAVSNSPGPFGQNEWLVEEMYRKFREDPSSVDPSWHEFLVDYSAEPAVEPDASTSDGRPAEPAAPPELKPTPVEEPKTAAPAEAQPISKAASTVQKHPPRRPSRRQPSRSRRRTGM